MLVSIIINNYNYGRFLGAAIDSALAQTYPLVEVIVVDDGSTDHSRAIVQSYGDRITPVFKENGGQASALNAGFAQASGEVVIFLDADDVLLPSVAERVVHAFQSDPSVSKVMYRMEVIGADGERTGTLKPPIHLPLQRGDLRRYVLTFPFDMVWVPTSGNAFSAQVLRHILPMPEQQFRAFPDYYLVHLAALFGPVAFIEEVGAYYRVHGGNNHERSVGIIDLEQIRRTFLRAAETCAAIKHVADQYTVAGRPQQAAYLLSVAPLSMRLISFKLDRVNHPIASDSIWRLCWAGVTAARHRFDVSPVMRMLYMVWFAALAVAPKTIAWQLARGFLFPEQRQHLNYVFTMLHRSHAP